MIQIQNTSHFAGIRIIGDVYSFRTLEEAIHKIVGEEGEYPIYESARLRALDFSKELQSSCTGEREIVLIHHGLKSEVVRSNEIAHQENLYIGFQSLWPEALFFTMVMNDFIKLYEKKVKHPAVDSVVTPIRQFQSGVYLCIEEMLSKETYMRIINMIHRNNVRFNQYITQYVDHLNTLYVELDKEKRKLNMILLVKRLSVKGRDYQEYKFKIMEEAREQNCSHDEIEVGKQTLNEIIW